MEQDPRWAAAGNAVVNRRVELGMRTRAALAATTGLTVKTLGEIERGERGSYDPATLATVEQALRWPTGHLGAILSGGNVAAPQEPRTDGIPPVLAELALLLSPDSPLSAEGRELLAQALDRLVALVKELRPY